MIEEARGSAGARRFHDEARAWVERELERELARVASARGVPPRLAEAMRYALLGGGKRVRPALVRLVCRSAGGSDADARSAALAIECVHGYSLVHDDLPCMDDDDLRRGRPTCHVAYGEALAVLAGDALLTLAFELVATAPRNAAEQARVLARAAGAAGMVGGQALDLELEGKPATLDDVRAIHAGKTAALIGAACELGALAAGRDAEAAARARAFGVALGCCFQAVDDVIDVTSDAAHLGKTPGKDAEQEKASLVAALGLDGARAEAARLAEEARGAARALAERLDDAAGSLALLVGTIELVLDRDG